MESREEKDMRDFCNERDVKGQNHHKAISQLCDERMKTFSNAQASFSCEHDLCFPGLREPLSFL